MSDDSLEKAKRKVLQAQRRCGWCKHVAESAEGLVRHVLEEHRPDGFRAAEARLLVRLQRMRAK